MLVSALLIILFPITILLGGHISLLAFIVVIIVLLLITFALILKKYYLQTLSDEVQLKRFDLVTEYLQQQHTEGDPGTGMYIIVAGEIKIKMEDKIIAHLKKHDFFGELALFDRSLRQRYCFRRNR